MGADEGVVHLQQRLALARVQSRVLADRRSDTQLLVLLGGVRHARLLVQHLSGEVEVARDRGEHLLRRLSQSALDLRHVRIGDADHVGELAHRERVQLPLVADDLSERRLLSRPRVEHTRCPVR